MNTLARVFRRDDLLLQGAFVIGVLSLAMLIGGTTGNPDRPVKVNEVKEKLRTEVLHTPAATEADR